MNDETRIIHIKHKFRDVLKFRHPDLVEMYIEESIEHVELENLETMKDDEIIKDYELYLANR